MRKTPIYIAIILILTILFLLAIVLVDQPHATTIESGHSIEVNCEEKQEVCGEFLKDDLKVCVMISEPTDKLSCQYWTIEGYKNCLGNCPEIKGDSNARLNLQ